MVYESDFYTSRRPYSTRVTPSVSSYSVTRRRAPANLTPTMLRVGEVPPPFTAFGRATRAAGDESGLTAVSQSRRTFRSVAPDLPSHLYDFYRYYR